MPDARLDKIREYLRDLKGRLARGEVDEASYFRVKEELLSDLSPRDRQALGTASDAGIRPSGVPTYVPSLAELELAPGTVLFDQWRIVRELGRGGFGVVFEAAELHLGESLAIKVLDPAMTSRPELLARFRREVKVMRRLEPRHIVRVYDYREDPDEHLALISMEYVAGGTVRELRDLARRKRQPVPVGAVVAILAETLAALAEAHDQGVIHRDVTPGNILLAGAGPEELLAEPTREPGVKLVDFGIAGLVEHTELSQKTRALGTAPYVAPEALEPGGEVTPSADVYGAGVVAYELLTGRLPVGRFAQPSATRPDVPAELDRLLPELLDPDPTKRPSARRARERALSRRSRVPVPRRRTWIAAAALAATVVLVMLGYVNHWRSRELEGGEIAEPVTQPAAEPPAAIADEERATSEAPADGEAEPVGTVVDQDAAEVVAGGAETEAGTDEPSVAQQKVGSVRPAEVVEPAPNATPDSWEDPKIGMRFRYILAGTFTMGSPESEPGRNDDERQHEVTLTRAFWMAETEVTQGQWREVMGTAPSSFASCGDKCPVQRVNWYEAVTFANRLSRLSGLASCYEVSGCGGTLGGGCEGGKLYCEGDYRCSIVKLRGFDCAGYRLPTEAEWEYAARANTRTALYTGPLTIRGAHNGPELDEIAWYGGNSGVGYDGGYNCSAWDEKQYSSKRCGTHPVGRKRANGWDLHDMLGNVWEWTWDWGGDYEAGSVTDPMGLSRGSYRVLRGGGWDSSARYCRAANRCAYAPGSRLAYVGFRLVRTYP